MTLEFLWIPATLAAAAAQTARNALQKTLTAALGTVGATYVRFLYGLPFSLLFLLLVATVSGAPPPIPGAVALAWTACGGLAQILATALMLAAMRQRSFAVAIAYTKTEPVQVALVGLVALGDRVSLGDVIAIATATLGVVIMSLGTAVGRETWRDLRPAGLGLAAGALFAVAAVGYRGAILALPAPNFVIAATTILVVTLALQTVVLSVWLAAVDRPTLVATLKAWRPSLVAGFSGAFASQFWFLAFALTSAANVRTLALVEVLLAQIVSGRLFEEAMAPRELVGMALIVLGVTALLLY